MILKIFTDGGARGNPGPAAIGVVMVDSSGKVLCELAKKIGATTNNVAEYQAVIEALQYLVQNKSLYKSDIRTSELHFFLDSTLVVNQLNGLFKVKNQQLRQHLLRIRDLEVTLQTIVTYHTIPRQKNYRADFLVNRALDEK